MQKEELEKLNKAQLIDKATELGISTEGMTKPQIVDAILKHEANGTSEEQAPTQEQNNEAPTSEAEQELTAEERQIFEGLSQEEIEKVKEILNHSVTPVDGFNSLKEAGYETAAKAIYEIYIKPEEAKAENAEKPVAVVAPDTSVIRSVMQLELAKRQSRVNSGFNKPVGVKSALQAEIAKRGARFGSSAKISDVKSALKQELMLRSTRVKK